MSQAEVTTPLVGHTTRDPVCGMVVDAKADKPTSDYHGQAIHFCNPSCKEKFDSDPKPYLVTHDPVDKSLIERSSADFLGKHEGQKYYFANQTNLDIFNRAPEDYASAAPQPSVPAGTKWICPMDPEIEEDEFGECPICGMALEPAIPNLDDDGPNPELVDFISRFKRGLLLTIPLLILAMGPHIGLDFTTFLSSRSNHILQFALATPMMIWIGLPFLRRAWSSLVTRHPNMWTLIGLGTGAAYFYSTVAVLLPGLFPPALLMADGTIGVYFESTAVIILLVLLGQIMELKARERTGNALRGLLALAPKTAWRLGTGGIEEISIDDIRVGDHLRVQADNRIPVDGVVIDGHSTVDESMLTGEPMPVEKTIHDVVTGGTLNGSGSFIMAAQAVGTGTVLAQIVMLVSQAQRSRAPVQALADRVAAWFVPGVVLIAVMAFFLWLLLGPAPSLSHAIIALVSVLIIACPCALSLATPMSIGVAAGRGARAGILIKEAAALESLANINMLVVDKTGTLTAGKPELTDCIVAPNSTMDRADIIATLAALEQSSSHPLAKAIIAAADPAQFSHAKVTAVQSITGKGLIGEVNDKKLLFGNTELMHNHGVKTDHLTPQAQELRAAGKTVMFATIDGKLVAMIAVADPIKPSALAAMKELRAQGITVIMATGDAFATANAVATALDITQVEAGLLPAEKAALVTKLHNEGYKVAMAGDGVNDAPALVVADVGIAMASGSEIAIDSAGLALMNGDLAALVRARKLAKASMGNIRQNLFFAFIYNSLGVPVAAGLFYPLFGWLLSPAFAAAAMSLSSVSVIINALRLNRVQLD